MAVLLDAVFMHLLLLLLVCKVQCLISKKNSGLKTALANQLQVNDYEIVIKKIPYQPLHQLLG